ncbi:ATP-dependent helicase [Agrobacterium sp. MOPV5]|uniref:UvrD-helicase domain-containing protein n=1 Tax=Agrobacterium leguminum TaxID=2792015 RepID=UPI0018C1F1B1|nr:ATP-dependent helicase [Agrobacterium leguminum]MBG0511064.1 ATP-dependent helicase [Agrobacterium leguminum]
MTRVRPEDWRPQGIDEIEDRAWEALRETERNVAVTAGAGAGKTEFLAQKAAYLLQTGLCPAPKRILAISFKRDAAETLSKRVERRCAEAQARRFHSLTFDSFTKRLVDQFRMAIPADHRPPANYEITFPTAAIINDFLRRSNIRQINAKQMTSYVERARLPIATLNAPEQTKRALERYWEEQFAGPTTHLTFAMLNRLADYLVRSNVRIARALRNTYPFVFLDEFQDATPAQFGILMNAFDPNTTIFTAVGDGKQRIMGFAGALPDAFATLSQSCNPREIQLLSNWRSHDDLVTVQHRVARQINPNVERVVARRARAVAGNVSGIWVFDNRAAEITTLAAWLAREIIENQLPSEQFAVLVRMLADNVENELRPALAEHGLSLRNLARNVGGAPIQDTLVEPLTQMLFPLMLLGAVRRDRTAWSQTLNNLKRLSGAIDDDEAAQQRLNARAEALIKSTRQYMRDNPASAELAGEIVERLIDNVGEQEIRTLSASYQRDRDFDRVKAGLVALLRESLESARTWLEALDRLQGKDQIALMTVHKSKGMEFHTMIFFGLDDRSWRSLDQESPGELNAFYVALTRAQQRAFFTTCAARGHRIEWLEDMLGDDVARVNGETILDAEDLWRHA